MILADFEDFRPKDDDPLTEDEVARLSEALGDGFTSVTMLPEMRLLALKDIVEEPFWGTTLRASEEDLSRFEDFSKEMSCDGYTNNEIAEAWLERQEDDRSDDAPSWTESNPFGFNLDRLEEFFVSRCDASLGDYARLLLKNGGDYTYLALIEIARPFSRTWFEIHIAHELWLLRGLYKDLAKNDSVTTFWAKALFERAGTIGRMIESYRWRFAYGHHALRGKKVANSAEAGGHARARAASKPTARTLSEMATFIEKGHSVSRAAELAASRGIGSSKAANRRLWSRHRKK